MPEIFDKITDQTKKLNVENITKKEGFPLDISVMVHDMTATHGEQMLNPLWSCLTVRLSKKEARYDG
jgi:hypothetical protein